MVNNMRACNTNSEFIVQQHYLFLYSYRKNYECLKEEYVKLPSTKDEWKDIANSAQKIWQFPSCIGAADGKHISILHTCGSGSELLTIKDFIPLFC